MKTIKELERESKILDTPVTIRVWRARIDTLKEVIKLIDKITEDCWSCKVLEELKVRIEG